MESEKRMFQAARETSQESQNDALEGSKGLLKDLNLWPLGSAADNSPTKNLRIEVPTK